MKTILQDICHMKNGNHFLQTKENPQIKRKAKEQYVENTEKAKVKSKFKYYSKTDDQKIE